MRARTYEAIATRSGAWWSVEIPRVSRGKTIYTQGRTLADAEAMAQDAIALTLDVPADDVSVRLRVAGVEEVLAAVEAARHERERAARDEQATLARVSAELAALGISQRDAARLLGLSHQRVSQLLHSDAA